MAEDWSGVVNRKGRQMHLVEICDVMLRGLFDWFKINGGFCFKLCTSEKPFKTL